jgi:hypothetical protein
MAQRHCTPKKGKIIKIDEEQVRTHVGEVVRSAVEETLNTLLSEEADRLCNAKRYERMNTGTERHKGWALHQGLANEFWRGDAEGTEAEELAF